MKRGRSSNRIAARQTAPLWLVLVSGLLLADPGLAEEGPSAPALVGEQHWQHDLGGWLVDWTQACPRSGDPCGAFFLVRDSIDSPDAPNGDDSAPEKPGEPEERNSSEEDHAPEPLRLLRMTVGADGPLFETLVDGIVGDLVALGALDVDGDGRPEPLLVERGRAAFVDNYGSVVPLLRAPGAPIRGLLESLDPHSPIVAWASVGKIRFFRIEGSLARELGDARLPVSAHVGAATLRLETPPVRRVESLDQKSSELFAVGPEEQGPSRWRVTLYRPEQLASGTVDPGVQEVWLRTPGPEKPVGARFVLLGGEPMLLAHALRSDKIGILERKKVRLYPLREDRTRSGVRPVFEHLSVSRLWQDLEARILDQDGDGGLELILLQREGFGGKKLQVDAFALDPSGRPSNKSSRSMIKVPWSEWSESSDLTGDGVADLLLQSQGLYLIAGRTGRKGPFDPSPQWKLALPESAKAGVMVSISGEEIGAEGEERHGDGGDEDWPNEDRTDRADASATDDRSGSRSISWGRPFLLGGRGDGASGGRIVLLIGRQERSRAGGGNQLFVLRLNEPE